MRPNVLGMSETLFERVRARGPRPWLETQHLLRGTSRALGQLHLRKRGHGAITPASITCIPGEGARALRVLVAPPRLGTVPDLAWEAPENVAATRRASPASDVWALGLVGYFVLVGRPLWRATTASGTARVIDPVQLVEEMRCPPRATERAAEQNASHLVWPALDAWLARCLALDPAERFASAPKAVAALLASRPRLARAATAPLRDAAPRSA